MRLDELIVAARDYRLTGSGRYSLDDDLDIQAVISLSQAVSVDLVDAVRQAKYLRSSQGRIEIPIQLSGPIPGRAQPDVSFIASAVSRNLLQDALEKQLGLRGWDPADAAAGTTGSGEASTEGSTSTKTPEEAVVDLINTGLGELFKRK